MLSSRFASLCLTTLCAAGSLSLGSLAHAQGHYMATDLTDLGGAFQVNSLTRRNGVVGDANGYAFLYDQTGFHTLGSLVPGGGSQGWAANSNGQVTGISDIDFPALSPPHAFLYDSTGMHDLGTLAGGNYSFGQVINEHGVVGGFSTNGTTGAPSEFHAVYWDSAGIHDLGNYGSYAGVVGINDNNQMLIVAGTSGYLHDATGDHLLQTNSGDTISPYALGAGGQVGGYINGVDSNGDSYQHAALYDNTGGHDLGLLTGGSYSAGYGVSDNGMVIGDADVANGSTHAFLGNKNGLVDLGVLAGDYSSAYAINSLGQVVGLSDDGAGSTLGFLYDQGQMYDLNALTSNLNGDTFDFANFINDNGYIVGTGHDANGNQHVFALAPTPEPSTLAMLATAGLTGTLLLKRRKAHRH
ncbi:MAG: repeat protein [Chthonomonadales bacterium]|nr:repeat protein [Chthonomonadales bacterium]